MMELAGEFVVEPVTAGPRVTMAIGILSMRVRSIETLDDRVRTATSVDEGIEGRVVSSTLKDIRSRNVARRSRTLRLAKCPSSSFPRDVDGAALVEGGRGGCASDTAPSQSGGGRLHSEHRCGEGNEAKSLVTAIGWPSDRNETLCGDERAQIGARCVMTREERSNHG